MGKMDRASGYLVPLLGLFVISIALFSSTDYAFATPSIEDSGSINILPVGSTSTITIPSATTGVAADKFLIVGVSIDHSKAVDETITSVVFGPAGPACSLITGIPLTLVPGTTSTSAFSYNQIYSLTELQGLPSGEDCDIVITLTGPVGDLGLTTSTAAGANFVIFSGVDQTNPIEPSLTVQTTTTSTTPSASIVTGADHFAYDVMSAASITVLVPTVGASQTLVASQAFTVAAGPFSTAFAMGSSTQPGVADGTMSWTLSSSTPWDVSSIAIRDSSLPAIVSSSSSEKSKGGCDSDCIPPTLGVDFTGKILVDNGFTYNGYTTDVNLFYTPFPLITVNVGDENVAELKIYENSGTSSLHHVGLGFGLAKDKFFSHAAATIEIDFDYDGTQTVSVYDPENALENIRVETDEVDCRDTVQIPCTLVKIYHTFRTPLEFNIVSTNVWDQKRNAWQNNYNHGIQIEGDSLNPPKTALVVSGDKNIRGLLQITQINTTDDLWIDEFGSVYLDIGNNRFDKISQVEVEEAVATLTSHGCNRECSWFTDYKYYQYLLAEDMLNEILQGKDIAGYLEDSKSIYISQTARSENVELQNSIKNQIEITNDLYDELYHHAEKPTQNFE